MDKISRAVCRKLNEIAAQELGVAVRSRRHAHKWHITSVERRELGCDCGATKRAFTRYNAKAVIP